jgi:hypothetical protein
MITCLTCYRWARAWDAFDGPSPLASINEMFAYDAWLSGTPDWCIHGY